jgi:hypothetical protein
VPTGVTVRFKVRYGSLADIRERIRDVRFTPKSGHSPTAVLCPRSATSEFVETDAVEKLWTSKLRAFRNRILGILGRVQYLSPWQTIVLQQELRATLEELADDKGA